MDVLSDILGTVRLKGTLYFRTEFSPPWAIQVPDLKRTARFHLVVRGMCFVRPDAGAPVALSAGDMAIIPHGAPHVISADGHAAAAALETVLEETRFKGRGALVYGGQDTGHQTQLICGHFSFADGADHPLLRALPTHLLVSADLRRRHPWLDETLRLLASRVFAEGEGAAAAVHRLSEIVFIESLRACADQSPELARLVMALADDKIGQAIRLMHEAPDRAWTVDALASAVAMSRSRFAERFQHFVGCGPLAYLSEWRMQRALSMLTDGKRSISEIAQRNGYRSQSAFTRAFTQRLGRAPSDIRRAAAH